MKIKDLATTTTVSTSDFLIKSKADGSLTEKITVGNLLTASYKIYVANLTQSGTAAPVATEFQRTLTSAPTYSYISDGTYRITATGLFTVGKTFVNITQGGNASIPINGYIIEGINSIIITSTDTFSLSNNMLINTGIEIRVYP